LYAYVGYFLLAEHQPLELCVQDSSLWLIVNKQITFLGFFNLVYVTGMEIVQVSRFNNSKSIALFFGSEPFGFFLKLILSQFSTDRSDESQLIWMV